MNVILVYLRLYADCVRKAARGIRKNLWTLALPGALMIVAYLGAMLASQLRLGLIGGLLLTLLTTALTSSYLSFLAEVVADGKATLEDLRESFLRLFWPVMGVGFVLWIANLLLSPLTRGPNGATIGLFINLVELLLVFVNPTPEVIYRRGMSSGLATLQHSFSFVQQNWIEWYLPTALMAAIGWFVWPWLLQAGIAGGLLGAFLLGALLHVAMVFRGHLYLALDGTSHRQRMFRYRTGQ